MRKRILISLIIAAVLVAVVIFLRPQSPPQVFGKLSTEDVAEITRIVRNAMRREVFPDYSLNSIRRLPSSLQRHWSDRILSIHAGTNKTVEGMTGIDRGPLDGGGNTYELEQGSKGWEITDIGFWVSSVKEVPGKPAFCAEGLITR